MTVRSVSQLEERVLDYHPELRQKLEKDPEARGKLEKIVGEEYKKYSPYIGGVISATSSVGRGFGYVGDIVFFASAIAAASNPLLAPYMLTGLLLKKGNVVAQIPEVLKTAKYVWKTRDVLGGLVNVGAKVASYVPGLTIVDRGLSRIAESRAIKKSVYRINEELGIENKSWYRKIYDSIKGVYSDVKDRRLNIVRPVAHAKV